MRNLLNRFRDWLLSPVVDLIRHGHRSISENLNDFREALLGKEFSNLRKDNAEVIELAQKCEWIIDSIERGTIAAIHTWINEAKSSRVHLESINRQLIERWKASDEKNASEFNRLKEENQYLRDTINAMFAEEDELKTNLRDVFSAKDKRTTVDLHG
jgi:hypothetical protein